MGRLVSRDPFAREELYRSNVFAFGSTCAWCGQTRHTRAGQAYLYRYRVETDGGRTFEDDKLFCSLDCRRTHREG